MRAIRMHESGGIEKLVWEDVPEPQIGGRDVLVRVRACAMNHLDAWATKASPGRQFPEPRVLGSDIAGVVEAVGADVTSARPGDRVMLSAGVSCGECMACLSGQDNDCLSYAILGTSIPGGYAELVRAPAVNAIPIPEGMSFEEAAAIPLVFVTAWEMAVRRAQVRLGEWVLVNAAGSGVGSAAIQIAKLFGARVVTTASTRAKLEKAKVLGADAGVDYTRENWGEEVRHITDGHGVDVVLDSVGGDVFLESVRAMARRGRLVSCGSTSGNMVNFDLRLLTGRRATLIGSMMGRKADLLQALEFFKSGQLKPVIDRVIPIQNVAQGHQAMIGRDLFGKIVLTW